MYYYIFPSLTILFQINTVAQRANLDTSLPGFFRGNDFIR